MRRGVDARLAVGVASRPVITPLLGLRGHDQATTPSAHHFQPAKTQERPTEANRYPSRPHNATQAPPNGTEDNGFQPTRWLE